MAVMRIEIPAVEEGHVRWSRLYMEPVEQEEKPLSGLATMPPPPILE